MADNQLLIDPNLDFQVLNPGVSREAIDSLIPYEFSGKEDFIRFYLTHDGVYFPDGAAIDRSLFQKAGDDEYDELEIEYIYRMADIIKMREANGERSAIARKFVETHIPFARDAAGNEFFIEIPAGMIKYVALEYDIEEGLLDVAANFKEFCFSIKPLD